MYSLTLDRPRFSARIKTLGVLLFAVATAVSARVSVPLAFTPVPLTLQVLTVILSGLVLGWRGGLMAQAIYLQVILLGAPLSAAGLGGPSALISPTAGYLWAFPLAAALAGRLSRSLSRPLAARAAGSIAGLLVIYALGMLWLSGFVGGLHPAWELGVLPFIVPDLLKVLIAGAGLSLRRR